MSPVRRYRATGDSVGNNGEVEIRLCADGTLRLTVENYRETACVWLLPRQAVHVATALLSLLTVEPPPPPEPSETTQVRERFAKPVACLCRSGPKPAGYIHEFGCPCDALAAQATPETPKQ